VDNILKTLLGNANLSGALLACFMDNTIPGKRTQTFLYVGLTLNPITLNENKRFGIKDIMFYYFGIPLWTKITIIFEKY